MQRTLLIVPTDGDSRTQNGQLVSSAISRLRLKVTIKRAVELSEADIIIAGGQRRDPAKSEARLLYNDLANELEEISKNNPTFHIFPWYSKIQGHLTALDIKQHSPHLDEAEIFLCGPPIVMHSLTKSLHALGISSSKIHSEDFSMS